MIIDDKCQKCILVDRHKCKDCKQMTARQALRVLEATVGFAEYQAGEKWEELAPAVAGQPPNKAEREIWALAGDLHWLRKKVQEIIPEFYVMKLLEFECTDEIAEKVLDSEEYINEVGALAFAEQEKEREKLKHKKKV